MLERVLASFVKGMKIRLRKSWLSLAEWKAPQRRNCRWCDEFMINHDGYWLYCEWHGLFKQKIMNTWACMTFLITKWLVEVLLALPGVVLGNGICVAGCYWWGFGTCCGIGWGWEWLSGWRQEVGHVIHGHKPIPIIINHKFTIPSSISTLGDFSLSQTGQPILAQPNFHTLNKSGQCSPKHKSIFRFFGCHMIDATFRHPYIWKFPQNVSHFSFGRLYSKVSTFFWDTRYKTCQQQHPVYKDHILHFPWVATIDRFHCIIEGNGFLKPLKLEDYHNGQSGNMYISSSSSSFFFFWGGGSWGLAHRAFLCQSAKKQRYHQQQQLEDYCTSWNFRGGFIFANFARQTLAKISTSIYVYL